MMKSLLITLVSISAISTHSFAQTVTYDIPIGSLIGMELTSGDICTAPWNVEEAKQIAASNTWGGTWTSTYAGTPTSIVVELSFSVSDGTTPCPTTLNGVANNSVDPGPAVNCAVGTALSWTLDPASYNAMALNTFLIDFSSSPSVHQLDNFPIAGDPYIRVTVTYPGVSIEEQDLTQDTPELIMITDLMGRETEFKANTTLIYIYSDGSTKRMFSYE